MTNYEFLRAWWDRLSDSTREQIEANPDGPWPQEKAFLDDIEQAAATTGDANWRRYFLSACHGRDDVILPDMVIAWLKAGRP